MSPGATALAVLAEDAAHARAFLRSELGLKRTVPELCASQARSKAYEHALVARQQGCDAGARGCACLFAGGVVS